MAVVEKALLDFLRDGANECVLPAGVHWRTSSGKAPEGFGVYRFTAEECIITVSYPLAMEEAIYHVALGERVTGFCWQANVDARGRVLATGGAAGLLPELVNAAAAYCKEQSYRYEIRTQPNGSQCGMCIFPDDSVCNAWMFFQGECRPGDITADVLQ